MSLPKLNAPTYELKIPSTGKMISYRPYLVKEEKILMLAMESNDDRQMIRAIKDVISACTSDAADTSNITMFDMEYIFTQLRSKSVGESVQVSMNCSECNTSNEIQINLEDVSVKSDESITDTIELTDTIGVRMKYPSVDAVLSSRIDSESNNVDKIFSLLVECVDSIYSGEEIFDAASQSREELNGFIESLNAEQFARIRKFVENIPATVLDVTFKCSNCEHKNETSLRGLSNFFG